MLMLVAFRMSTPGIPLDDFDRLIHFSVLSVVIVACDLLGGLAGGRMLWRRAVIVVSWVLLEIGEWGYLLLYVYDCIFKGCDPCCCSSRFRVGGLPIRGSMWVEV
ncbi:hypothetical protein OUZ56_017444 [Daphnia magna]|uniref:Transmembrane protein n=1 Tax=Daphnia magna TaxID=35525 RepID=A0ABR0AST4_9CRUS|nr:hypothetical protein OUZ56_017444 [Daphnia magna]